MTVLSTRTDPEALTLTLVAEFSADVERVWQLWSDPRQLERWWGPPTWPAIFDEHDFVEGGSARYHMTGPDGEQAPGWWRFTAIQAPTHLEILDGFADQDGEPDPSMPTMTMSVDLTSADAVTRMTMVSTFASVEQMDQLVQMGMVEGLTEAVGQIEGVLEG